MVTPPRNSKTNNEQYLQEIGRRLKTAREKSGLSVADAANAIDCSRRWIYLIENGNQNFTIVMLKSFADIVGLTLEELFVTSGAIQEQQGQQEAYRLSATAVLKLSEASAIVGQMRQLLKPPELEPKLG